MITSRSVSSNELPPSPSKKKTKSPRRVANIAESWQVTVSNDKTNDVPPNTSADSITQADIDAFKESLEQAKKKHEALILSNQITPGQDVNQANSPNTISSLITTKLNELTKIINLKQEKYKELLVIFEELKPLRNTQQTPTSQANIAANITSYTEQEPLTNRIKELEKIIGEKQNYQVSFNTYDSLSASAQEKILELDTIFKAGDNLKLIEEEIEEIRKKIVSIRVKYTGPLSLKLVQLTTECIQEKNCVSASIELFNTEKGIAEKRLSRQKKGNADSALSKDQEELYNIFKIHTVERETIKNEIELLDFFSSRFFQYTQPEQNGNSNKKIYYPFKNEIIKNNFLHEIEECYKEKNINNEKNPNQPTYDDILKVYTYLDKIVTMLKEYLLHIPNKEKLNQAIKNQDIEEPRSIINLYSNSKDEEPAPRIEFKLSLVNNLINAAFSPSMVTALSKLEEILSEENMKDAIENYYHKPLFTFFSPKPTSAITLPPTPAEILTTHRNRVIEVIDRTKILDVIAKLYAAIKKLIQSTRATTDTTDTPLAAIDPLAQTNIAAINSAYEPNPIPDSVNRAAPVTTANTVEKPLPLLAPEGAVLVDAIRRARASLQATLSPRLSSLFSPTRSDNILPQSDDPVSGSDNMRAQSDDPDLRKNKLSGS